MTTQHGANRIDTNASDSTAAGSPVPLFAPRVTCLTDAILATVAYYDIFERPLTAREIVDRLIGHAADETAVIAELGESPRLREALGSADGYYALAHRLNVIAQYHMRAATQAGKWSRVQGFGRVACHIPFLRALIVGGSLANGSTRRQSDLDLCVLVAEGRLWLARACLWVLRLLWNASRRRPLVTPKQDKLDILAAFAPPGFTCHNQSLYAAVLLRDGIVIYEEDALAARYATANDWVLAYCPGFTRLHLAPTMIRPPRITLGVKRAAERLLSLPPFDLAERAVFHWWRHRWERFAAATDRPLRLIVATPHAADLYSHYWQDQVMAQYRERLAALNLLAGDESSA